jgi:RimJ/RimL family protein N-acetyltransferase
MNIHLEGKHVILRPMQLSDAKDLWKNTGGDEGLWKWVLTTMPIPTNENEMQTLVATLIEQDSKGDRVCFAVYSKAHGEVVGSTSYLAIDNANKSREIGSTFYGEVARRSAINTECKYLLMQYAFETLGCERVQIKADNTNERSLTAIARLGVKREGELRHDRLRRDGTWRNAVYFSAISAEWPALKKHLVDLLNPAM